MEKVKIVQLDGPMMNLALSKIARYHVNRGDEVSFIETDPDVIYFSAIFSKTAKKYNNLKSNLLQFSKDVRIEVGGSAFNDRVLPPEIDCLMPYYDLWGVNYSLGYTSRGCIRKCKFCVVPRLEGGIRDYQHPSQFVDARFKNLILLDNNFLASPKWKENIDWIIDRKLRVNFNQGLDIRLMTQEMADRLALCKSSNWKFNGENYYFAWDNIGEEKQIRRGLETFLRSGVSPNKVIIYVLAGFVDAFDSAFYRCRILIEEYKVHPYIMRFDGGRRDQKLNELARWANRPAFHRNHTFEEYRRREVLFPI